MDEQLIAMEKQILNIILIVIFSLSAIAAILVGVMAENKYKSKLYVFKLRFLIIFIIMPTLLYIFAFIVKFIIRTFFV